MDELRSAAEGFITHEVTNQPPSLSYDAWATDTVLREAVNREGGAWAEAELALRAWGV
jgi:putative acyl-CoA dehydrogenase